MYYNYDEATVGLYFSYFEEISVESPLPGSRVDRRATQFSIYSYRPLPQGLQGDPISYRIVDRPIKR